MNLNSINAHRTSQFLRVPEALTKGSSAPTAEAVDTVECDARARHREPSEAISFMSSLNTQLGLSEEMIGEKAELMAESSHTFFRATPALFFQDLHTTYQASSRLLPEVAPTVAILGDAHALNAGTFRGPEGKTVWGLNDFDQAEYGSPEWDLERLGVSLYVSARSGGKSAEESMRLVESMGRSYATSLGEKGPSYLEESESSGPVSQLIGKAKTKKQTDFLAKWTTDDGRRLVRNKKLEEPDSERGKQIQHSLEETFPELKFLDLAAKPHSGGSTRGLERYYALVESQDRDEPWILETKAVLPSPVQIPDGDLSRGDGQKILTLQAAMGGHVDHRHRSFQLGETAFFTREREKEKGSLGENIADLEASAQGIGKLLARTHTQSGADLQSWIGDREDLFIDKLVQFSRTYARQVESDFRLWQQTYQKQS